MENTGERQVAPTLDGIREDHVARYRFAVEQLAALNPGRVKKDGTFKKGQMRVIDAGCGIGYGSKILAEAGCQVLAIDNCAEVLDAAQEHYSHENIQYLEADLTKWTHQPTYQAAVAFECLEHLKSPGVVLRALRDASAFVMASVPNESVFPHRGRVAFHERHYTGEEFEGLLNEAKLEVTSWFGQENQWAKVEPNRNGWTLIVTAEENREPKGGTWKILPEVPPLPKNAVIVAQGFSKMAYLTAAMQLGGELSKEWDTVVAINSMGGVIKHDVLFHMDDVLVQEERQRLNGEVGGILSWLPDHPGPVYTSTTAEDVKEALGVYRSKLSEVSPDDEPEEGQEENKHTKLAGWIAQLEEALPRYEKYTGMVSYPLAEVLNNTGAIYLNNTVACAIAWLMYKGVESITLYGVDFTYPDVHISEKGRACCEHLIGMCTKLGISVRVPTESTLLDANEPQDMKFYGYDAWEVAEAQDESGARRITKKPKALPTAEEMEERYRKVPKKVEAA